LIGCILLKSGADFFASLHSFRLLRRVQREAELYVAFKNQSTPLLQFFDAKYVSGCFAWEEFFKL
ncbi:hypothetical protein KSF73_10950, partial [Burkholderiaceae bacterium DAT-1]|nr:hypothetical protein [Burkholderiaceae bacterium DAT-1]